MNSRPITAAIVSSRWDAGLRRPRRVPITSVSPREWPRRAVQVAVVARERPAPEEAVRVQALAHHLPDEERVALGLCVHRRGEAAVAAIARLARDAVDEVPHFIGVSPCRRTRSTGTRRRMAAMARASASERPTSVSRYVPTTSRRASASMAAQVDQKVECPEIGILQVLEHQQERRRGGEPVQESRDRLRAGDSVHRQGRRGAGDADMPANHSPRSGTTSTRIGAATELARQIWHESAAAAAQRCARPRGTGDTARTTPRRRRTGRAARSRRVQWPMRTVSRHRAVLPMPGSPATNTTPPRPPSRRRKRAASRRSSCARPTNNVGSTSRGMASCTVAVHADFHAAVIPARRAWA